MQSRQSRRECRFRAAHINESLNVLRRGDIGALVGGVGVGTTARDLLYHCRLAGGLVAPTLPIATQFMEPSDQANPLFTLSFFVYTTLPTIVIFFVALRRRSRLLSAAAFGVALACYYEAHKCIGGDDMETRYTTGCMIGSLTCVSWWFLYEVDLEHATFLVDGVPVARLPLMKRLRRLTELWNGSRNAGWNIQVVSAIAWTIVSDVAVIDFDICCRHIEL